MDVHDAGLASEKGSKRAVEGRNGNVVILVQPDVFSLAKLIEK